MSLFMPTLFFSEGQSGQVGAESLVQQQYISRCFILCAEAGRGKVVCYYYCYEEYIPSIILLLWFGSCMCMCMC